MTLLTLREAAELPVERVGGKAAGLARLAALDLPVPPAFVLDTDVHAAFRRGGGLPDALLAQALEELGPPLAVRSSATDEDVADKSAAGQYESVMGAASLDAVRDAVVHCYAAADSERPRAYRGGDAGGELALVLQREVAAQRAGVAFSADPVTGDAGAVVIEAVFGHGEGLVSGAVSPDRYRVARDTGEVVARRAHKLEAVDGRGAVATVGAERAWARVLRDDEARRASDLVLAAERGFGRPVDVEFCWAGQDLWLVQCRPITSLRAAA